MTSPDFDVFAHDVPIVTSMSVARESSEAEDSEEVIPVAVLDFDANPRAAEIMMDWLARESDELWLGAYPEVWVPVPSLREPDAFMRKYPGAPAVRIVIAPTEATEVSGPVEVIAFRVPVMTFGTFMSEAGDGHAIGIVAASETTDESFAPVILGAMNDPGRMAWVELLAWRHALASESPDAYQRTIPLP